MLFSLWRRPLKSFRRRCTFRPSLEILEDRSLLSGITFQDIAALPGSGIDYQRVPSATNAAYEALKHQGTFTFNDLVNNLPEKPRGSPGVVIFDYNNDGYPDIFVTNGPGGGCKLYENLMDQTGKLQFKDVSAQAGVACLDLDATGAVAGDFTNDGYQDLFVLGRNQPNRLFHNNGNGTFTDVTAQAGVGGRNYSHTSASLGDINGDGSLDIVVANTYDWSNERPIFAEPFALNQPNQLFLNDGHGHFKEVSDSSGIRNLAGIPAGAATITWAIAMVDLNLDGKIDIVQADDQGAIAPAKFGGVDRGFIHVLSNDGSGQFTDVSQRAGFLSHPGAWMGLSFGDFNSDGHMDLFATDFGDYGPTLGLFPYPYQQGSWSAQWFLGQGDGTFVDPGLGALKADPFGWGTSTLDYDNSGKTDIAYFGHIDVGLDLITDNPGAILVNDGSGNFSRDTTAFAGGTDYNRHEVFGTAVGDLTNNGFDDIVTVSAMDVPDSVPLTRYPISLPPNNYGSPFDSQAYFIQQFHPTGPGTFAWNGYEFPNGTLQVQVNSADNGNGWVKIRTRGNVGLISNARVNRDGIGAVVEFTPDGGKEVMKPIVAGSSFGSQDSLTADFGLGQKEKGTVDIVWPGGVRNRLYDVHSKENLLFPEIPYSYDTKTLSFGEFAEGAARSLAQMVHIGELTEGEAGRFLSSALRAYREVHGMEDGGDNAAGGASSHPLPDFAGSLPNLLLIARLVADNLAQGADGGGGNGGNGQGGGLLVDAHAALPLTGRTVTGNEAVGGSGVPDFSAGAGEGGGSACADIESFPDGSSASTSGDDGAKGDSLPMLIQLKCFRKSCSRAV
jgi:hypothetical protein